MAEQELVEGAWSTQSTDLIMNHLGKQLETVDKLILGGQNKVFSISMFVPFLSQFVMAQNHKCDLMIFGFLLKSEWTNTASDFKNQHVQEGQIQSELGSVTR